MEPYKTIMSHVPTSDDSVPANSSGDAPLPKEKKLIRCDLCGRTVNSEKQAQAHVNGMYHLSRMQARGMPLPPETDLEKLRQFNAKTMKGVKNAPIRQPVSVPNYYSRRGASFDLRMPGPTGMSPLNSYNHQPGMTPLNNFNHQPGMSALNTYNNQPVSSKRVCCEICGVTANSSTQAQSHLNGRKHLSRLVELGMSLPPGVPPDFVDTVSLPFRQNRTNFEAPKIPMHERFSQRVPQFPTPRFQYSQPHGPRMYPYRTSNTVLNNPSPFLHNGPPHHPYAGTAAGASSGRGPSYQVRQRNLIPCEVCQLLFNSQGQATAHFSGSKHQKKIRMVNYYQRNVEKAQSAVLIPRQIICSVCSTTVNSEKQMEAHVQGKLHKSKLEQKTVSEVKEEERDAGDTEVKKDGGEAEEEKSAKSTSVYDLANCVSSLSLNSGIYQQQPQQSFSGPVPDDAVAVNQSI